MRFLKNGSNTTWTWRCTVGVAVFFVGFVLSVLFWSLFFISLEFTSLNLIHPVIVAASTSTLVAICAGIWILRHCGQRWP